MSQEANIFKMKQPQLGKHIAQLRQTQGLTQEELVEKCNISVRTIQRIESGDVTPRSYTIKTIFNALDYDFTDFVNEESGTNTSQLRRYKNWLQLAIVGGIIYFLVGIPEGVMEYLRVIDDMSMHEPTIANGLYIIVKIISVLSAVAFLVGFWIAASHYKLEILKYATVTFGIIYILAGMADITSLYVTAIDGPELVFLELIFFAIGGVFFGASLVMSRSKIGDIALIAGVLEIAMATCLITFILSFVSLILSIPTIIVGVILLYQVRKNMALAEPAGTN